jgi:hypothetical protein
MAIRRLLSAAGHDEGIRQPQLGPLLGSKLGRGGDNLLSAPLACTTNADKSVAVFSLSQARLAGRFALPWS